MATLLLTACATSDPAPRVLLLEYDDTADEPGSACVYVVDGRSRDTLHGVQMPTDSVAAWLQKAVQAQLGMEAYPVPDVPPDAPYILLQKAYIQPIATVISGVVVLKVGDGEAETVVRGRATRTNWWGADSEQVRLLSDALDDALYKVGASIGGSASCAVAGGE